MSWACAAAGALVLLVFAAPLSSLTFGDNSQTGPIALLSLAVFLSVIAGAQGALLQGMRRIADLATLSVVSGVLSTVIAVPMVYFLGQRGLVPTLVAVAACSVLSTWWFSRKIKLLSTRMRASEVLRESSGLLSLGLAFMVSGLLMTGACYAVRVILLQRVGLEAAGVYQAAWTVGGLYVAYVLQAMSSDFYPRLVAKIDSPHDCNQLVNEQAHVSLLLGGPGILATLVFAPYLVAALYSVKFVGAVEVLRWIGLGMALRIVSYPMGYIIVAKNRRRLFVGTDLAWACFNIGMTYWCVIRFGVVGAGAAYALSYVLHCLMIYPIARRLTGFSWTRENQGAMLIFVGLITGVFAAPYLLPEPYASGLGVVAFLFSSLYSLSKLATLPGLPKLPNAISNTLQLVGSWRKGR
jgi:enterobacterial common antigen flippase